jgi:hypothetical protein
MTSPLGRNLAVPWSGSATRTRSPNGAGSYLSLLRSLLARSLASCWPLIKGCTLRLMMALDHKKPSKEVLAPVGGSPLKLLQTPLSPKLEFCG